MVEDVENSLSKVFTCMTTWNSVKAYQLCTQFQFILRPIGGLRDVCLDPVGSDSYERSKVGIGPHVSGQGNLSESALLVV